MARSRRFWVSDRLRSLVVQKKKKIAKKCYLCRRSTRRLVAHVFAWGWWFLLAGPCCCASTDAQMSGGYLPNGIFIFSFFPGCLCRPALDEAIVLARRMDWFPFRACAQGWSRQMRATLGLVSRIPRNVCMLCLHIFGDDYRQYTYIRYVCICLRLSGVLPRPI